MTNYVDLSHPLRTGMPGYPGDPTVEFESALTIASDGVAVERLSLGSHAGTHLDAPAHAVRGGRTVDAIPLDRLIGDALVLRAVAAADQRIGPADLAVPATLPGIVCIATGWDAHFGTAQALRHPVVTLELAETLWARGARVLALDTLSPDPTAQPDQGMPVHEYWLGRDGVIVENLRALAQIPDAVELSLVPLRLAGVDGSPIRAVARVG